MTRLLFQSHRIRSLLCLFLCGIARRRLWGHCVLEGLTYSRIFSGCPECRPIRALTNCQVRSFVGPFFILFYFIHRSILSTVKDVRGVRRMKDPFSCVIMLPILYLIFSICLFIVCICNRRQQQTFSNSYHSSVAGGCAAGDSAIGHGFGAAALRSNASHIYLLVRRIIF